MNKTVISVSQFQLLVILYTVGTTILIIPAGLAAEAKQDAWLAAAAGVAVGLPVVWLHSLVGRRLQGRDFHSYCGDVLGRWAGAAVTAFLVLFFFLSSATLLSYVGNFLTTQILVETPIEFIHLLFGAIVVMAMRLGLETIARTAEIFFPWFVGLFGALVLLLLPQVELDHVRPVFETEVKVLLRAGLTLAATSAMPLISFFLVFSSVQRPERIRGAMVSANLAGGLFIIIISFVSIAVLGADLTERLMYPSYALAKKVSVGKFIQRVEIIIAALWFISIFFKLTLYFHGCLVSLAKLAKLDSYRPLTLPMGMLLVIYGQVVYPNVHYMLEWDKKVWVPMMIVLGIFLPLGLLAVDLLRSRRKGAG
ncbi:GerAB/ArcD/ProY family transporter [Paenibacillus mucilaginosus]|uniref:Spore germination protein n=1 Tax=Paenibacillus mucilaginosus (strain KNP414) TaxID=1036673 RepID=F8FE39_PAEMK|nr:endospore germination permease [Paenibacillus mucilaginosus]AEI43798.1 spore germination protein [Paenibacillus mucilaginosus KNP414]MCG7212683.1 endospore germination permease [Paenibacillus mucilaginosus]WDM25298.1 endospore germination permease [Paenibacillus mucilaginosus]